MKQFRYTLFVLLLVLVFVPFGAGLAQTSSPTPQAGTSASPTKTPTIVSTESITSTLTISQTQTQPAQGATYTVQEGDTLWVIAERFRVAMADLLAENGITDPNALKVGDVLVIPGLEGIVGNLTTRDIGYGENLSSVSREYQIPPLTIARLNHLVSPKELFAGASLVIPVSSSTLTAGSRTTLTDTQSLLDVAIRHQTNPWTLAKNNALSDTISLLPGEAIFLPEGESKGPGALPEDIQDVTVDPLPPQQGKTFVIHIQAPEQASLSGSFLEHPLHFFPDKNGEFLAFASVHAMTEPGVYPLTLEGNLPDGEKISYSQMLPVEALDYPYDDPLTVDPETIDPAITKPEDDEWASYAQTVTPEKLWDGQFQMPGPLPLQYCLDTNDCWSSRFGNRRSYNGSTYSYFHSGLDVFGKKGTEIYAPADGVVVFTGTLTVRGNATMIDHGWGVYSGYLHQSEIFVKVGDHVKAGQLIGIVGDTGRVEGPHLHWEIWVNGVQVDPLDWLKQEFP